MRAFLVTILAAVVVGIAAGTATAQMNADGTMSGGTSMGSTTGATVETEIAALAARLDALRSIAVVRQDRQLYAAVDGLGAKLAEAKRYLAAGQVDTARRICYNIAVEATRLEGGPAPMPPMPVPMPIVTDSVTVGRIIEAIAGRLVWLAGIVANTDYADDVASLGTTLDSARALIASGDYAGARDLAMTIPPTMERIFRAIDPPPPPPTDPPEPMPTDSSTAASIARMLDALEAKLAVIRIDSTHPDIVAAYNEVVAGIATARNALATGDVAGARTALGAVMTAWYRLTGPPMPGPGPGPMPGDTVSVDSGYVYPDSGYGNTVSAEQVAALLDRIEQRVTSIATFAYDSVFEAKRAHILALVADGRARLANGDVPGAYRVARVALAELEHIFDPMPVPGPYPVPVPNDSISAARVAAMLDNIEMQVNSLPMRMIALAYDTALVAKIRLLVAEGRAQLAAGDVRTAYATARTAQAALARIYHEPMPVPEPGPTPTDSINADGTVAAGWIVAMLDAVELKLNSIVMTAFIVDTTLFGKIDRVRGLIARGRAELADGNIRAAWLTGQTAAEALAHLFGTKPEPGPPPIPLDSTAIARSIDRARAAIDTLEGRLAGRSLPAIEAELARTSALLDSADARLAAGRLVGALRALYGAREHIGRVSDALRLAKAVADGIPRVRAIVDSLSAVVANLGLPAADQLLARAGALIDSAEVRLVDGRIRAAASALERARAIVRDVRGLIREYATLAVLLPKFREELAAAETTIVASGDTLAAAFFAKAVEAADSAEARYAEGRVHAAMEALSRGHRALEQAIFVATAPERAAAAIAGLRERVESLLARIPETMKYERGVIERAGQLADSAQAALDRGEALGALRLTLKVHEALNRLLSGWIRPPIVVMPPFVDSTNVDAVIAIARTLIGNALVMANGVIIDPNGAMTTVRACVDSAMDKVGMAISARGAGNTIDASALAVAAYEAAVGAVEATNADAASDPVTKDMDSAGKIAAGLPLATPDGKPLPADYAISVAPNPFNPSTSIRYALPAAGNVRLVVYNSFGQQVRVLVDGERTAGTFEALWDGRNDAGRIVASGVYIARLEAGSARRVTRLVLTR